MQRATISWSPSAQEQMRFFRSCRTRVNIMFRWTARVPMFILCPVMLLRDRSACNYPTLEKQKKMVWKLEVKVWLHPTIRSHPVACESIQPPLNFVTFCHIAGFKQRNTFWILTEGLVSSGTQSQSWGGMKFQRYLQQFVFLSFQKNWKAGRAILFTLFTVNAANSHQKFPDDSEMIQCWPNDWRW